MTMIAAESKYTAMPAWKIYCRMNAALLDLQKLSLKLANANFNLHYGIDDDIDNHSEKNRVTPCLRSFCAYMIVESVAWIPLVDLVACILLVTSVGSKELDYVAGKTQLL